MHSPQGWKEVTPRFRNSRRRENDKNILPRTDDSKPAIRAENKGDGASRGFNLNNRQFPALQSNDDRSFRTRASEHTSTSAYPSLQPIRYNFLIDREHDRIDTDGPGSDDSIDECIRRKYSESSAHSSFLYRSILSSRQHEDDTKNYRGWIDIYHIELHELYNLMNKLCVRYLKLPKESKINLNHFLSFAYFHSSGRCPGLVLGV